MDCLLCTAATQGSEHCPVVRSQASPPMHCVTVMSLQSSTAVWSAEQWKGHTGESGRPPSPKATPPPPWPPLVPAPPAPPVPAPKRLDALDEQAAATSSGAARAERS